MSPLVTKLLRQRGLNTEQAQQEFLKPDYKASQHDPFLLPDMESAVERLVKARKNQDKITIYGDYDIDGLTATSLLLDAFNSFGFNSVDTFIPDRFREGYGLTVGAVERIAKSGSELLVTVDCGSLSQEEIERANELGLDVIVTDHHNVAAVQPPAVAVINPKRLLANYPQAYEKFVLKSPSKDSPLPSSEILEEFPHRSLDAGPVGTSAPSSRKSEISREAGAAPRAATRASALSASSDNASAETASPAATDPMVSPGAAAATSRLGEDELVLRPQTSREVVANETRRETSGTVAAGVAGLATQVVKNDGSGEVIAQPPTANSHIPIADSQPPAAKLYPFLDLAGVGVAFKLVQALQTRLDGLPDGQEKWLLDLVALGTVCDVVTLVDENRVNVHWGLEVMKKTRRPGIKALMAIARVEADKLNSRSLGFGLGPRLNASGRLETAKTAQDLLTATRPSEAYKLAEQLDEMNKARRAEQAKIFKSACEQADKLTKDNVLVVSDSDWSHGIIGIVAANLLEKYGKPTFVLQQLPDGSSKGSARSYGDFSAADAVRSADKVITKGGGHRLAAGVTMPTENIDKFRRAVNQAYKKQGLDLISQQKSLLPRHDTQAELTEVSEELIADLAQLEPFGQGNDSPVLKTNNLLVKSVKRMGTEGQHLKLALARDNKTVSFLAFSAPPEYFVEPGETVTVWYTPELNEWRGIRSVEGMLLHLEVA